MMLRIAWRSLTTRPVRAALLAAGFGFGIAVMAMLLGVGQIVLEQAHAPALQGGGDLRVSGTFGSVESATLVITNVLGAPDLARRIRVVSPSRRETVFLMTPAGPIAVDATGGIPSAERALGDPKTTGSAGWVDTPGDERWARPQAGDVLRAMDRFHPIADAPRWTRSWAEWLYFNGRTADGRVRVYVTFSVGPSGPVAGTREAAVRLQVERDGVARSYAAHAVVDDAAVLARAPDLDIAGNRVRLDGATYRLTLALDGVTGEIALDAAPGRSLPPTTIHGAGGWVSGYVVPVLAGTMHGALRVGGEAVTLEGAAGYHDHNWGFWEGVRWQWGQVAHDNLSIVYGRVRPPPDVADPDRIPGFLAVLSRDGPLAFSTHVTIDESRGPDHLDVHARGDGVLLQLAFDAGDTVRTPMGLPNATASSGAMTLLQMGGAYHVTGRAGGQAIDFTARGSAETFRRK